ncbi:hypothetical protein HYH03_015442 [Edaphochlamys debaryana]|uniref:PDZ domain-containing protein n=1 Tax=Edaphochlamys debaryana TaxID=47281 RepID=A0A836BSI6_9CHLO|nr:hypothetical protein HYH03_015442 [Edaphochlamys debaryana]|eukprot:KAG2485859.1 hypothetical protein HYH03_015442 [Edaphochlamys debaryana]
MFGTISRGCPMLRGLTPAATPLSARPLVTRAAASGGQGPDQTQSDRPRAGPLALALSTGLGLFLGAALGPAGPDALALGPGPAAAQEQSASAGPVLQPVAIAPADVAGTPAGLLDRLGLSPAPAPAPGRGEEPLQKKEVNPLTMQIPEAPADLAPEELRAIRLYARNTPSVVNVTNVRQVAVQNGYWGSMDLQKIPAGFGSGFIWDDKGHIATNYHVIQGAAEVKVTLIDQSTYTAKVVGGDADKDVAVLELQGVPPEKLRQLQPVTLGSSAALLVGQRVFAIGNPLGLEHTLTSGIVSGLNRELSTGTVTIKGLVQTDAAINPGNSGGVLLDSGGRVIGINTAIADPTGKGASSGVGFALPIDTVKGLVDQILTYGRVLRPVLGITLAPPQVLKQLGQPGVLVLEVPKGSPAAAAGLKPTKRDPFSGNLVLGDIITAIDGKPVKNYSDLVGVLDDKRVGDTVQVQILRSQTDNLFESGAARRMAVSVTLGERGMVNATGAE